MLFTVTNILLTKFFNIEHLVRPFTPSPSVTHRHIIVEMNKRDRVPISRSLSAVNPSIGVCKLPSPKYAPVTIRGVSSTTHCQSKTGEKTGEKTLEGMNIIQRSAPFDVLVERVCGKI